METRCIDAMTLVDAWESARAPLAAPASGQGTRVVSPAQVVLSTSGLSGILALASVMGPLSFVLACEAVGVRELGYTRSLVLFLGPLAAGAAWWFIGGRRTRGAVQWRALCRTVGVWTGIGWLLDLVLAASFFRFPDPRAVCGLVLPAIDLTNGGVVAVPIEEFAFYLLGFLVAMVAYLWFDRRPANSSPDADHQGAGLLGRQRLHLPTLAVGALLFMAAWLSKGALPGYALFLVLSGIVPHAWLLPVAWPRVNKGALGAAMVVLFLLAAIWEARLAIPNGWWAYNEQHMTAFVETPWSRLPIEAIAVWVLWPFTTIVTYEAMRARVEVVSASRPLYG